MKALMDKKIREILKNPKKYNRLTVILNDTGYYIRLDGKKHLCTEVGRNPETRGLFRRLLDWYMRIHKV